MVWQTRIASTVIALVAGVLFSATSARAELIQNGRFSDVDDVDGSAPPWTQLMDDYPVYFTANNAFLQEEIDDLDDYRHTVEVPGQPERSGTEFNLRGITQGFTLNDPAYVTLSFTYGLVGIQGETDYFDVLFDDTIVFTRSTAEPIPTDWVSVVTEPRFLGAGSHDLIFRLVAENDWTESPSGEPGDPRLTTVTVDDVTCAVVPLPGAALLGAIGLSYSGWRLQRRRPL